MAPLVCSKERQNVALGRVVSVVLHSNLPVGLNMACSRWVHAVVLESKRNIEERGWDENPGAATLECDPCQELLPISTLAASSIANAVRVSTRAKLDQFNQPIRSEAGTAANAVNNTSEPCTIGDHNVRKR